MSASLPVRGALPAHEGASDVYLLAAARAVRIPLLTAQIPAVLGPLGWHPLWDASLHSPSRRHPVLGAPIAVAYPFLAVFLPTLGS